MKSDSTTSLVPRLTLREAIGDKPMALFDPTAAHRMRALVGTLGLAPAAAEKLHRSAVALIGWQQLPRYFVDERGERHAPDAQARALAKQAASLLKSLSDLDLETRLHLDATFSGAEPARSLSGLRDGIEFLGSHAEKLAGVTKRTAGRPENGVALRTLTVLVMRVEEITGKKVVARKKRRMLDDPHLAGAEGEFITSWFQLVDPHVTAATLYRLLPKARARIRNEPSAVEWDVNSLKEGELMTLGKVTHHR